ncbi:MAG: hypothetical protein ACI4PQ_05530 [Butyricicoccaceae bacterium]
MDQGREAKEKELGQLTEERGSFAAESTETQYQTGGTQLDTVLESEQPTLGPESGVPTGRETRRSRIPLVIGIAAAVLAAAAIALWGMSRLGGTAQLEQPDAGNVQMTQADSAEQTDPPVQTEEPTQEEQPVQQNQTALVASASNEPQEANSGTAVNDTAASQTESDAANASLKEIIAAIKENYYGIQYHLEDFREEKRSSTHTRYYDSNGVLRKVVLKASKSEGRAKSEELYYDEDGNFTFGFAYDSNKNEYRYYYHQGLLYRYIDNHKNVTDYPEGTVPEGEAARLAQDAEALMYE